MQNIKLNGDKELIAKLVKMDGDLAGTLEAAVISGALIVQNDAKERAPYLTGTLIRSIHSETTEKSPQRVVVQVGTDVVYAAIQEFGGIITAKNGPYLRFKTRNGNWVTTASVNIPPHPYLRPSLDENKDKVQKEVIDTLRELVEAR